MIFEIIKYSKEYLDIWDNFVNNELFGTIYHTRQFINYHPENRFVDESILVYNENKELVTVLPCCKKENKYFSYSGATYGGPVISKKYYKFKHLKIIINSIFEYYDNKIEFRVANDIYFKESCYILYFLLSQKTVIYPELSWYINTNDNFMDNILNKRNKTILNKQLKDKSIICYHSNEINDYITFHSILTKNLNTNHNTNPTHSLDEFLKVKEILNDKQRLYLIRDKENILGGVYIIKVTSQCWYSFYISRNIEVHNSSISIMYLMYKISCDAKKENVKYVDYGISTEECGKIINEGLTEYKENSLGGTSNYRYLFLIK